MTGKAGKVSDGVQIPHIGFDPQGAHFMNFLKSHHSVNRTPVTFYMKHHTLFKSALADLVLSVIPHSLFAAKTGLPLSAIGSYTYTSEIKDWHGYIFAKPKGKLTISRFHRSGLKITIDSDSGVKKVILTSTGRYFVREISKKNILISNQSGVWFHNHSNGVIFGRSKSSNSSYTLKDNFGLSSYFSVFILNTSKGMYHKFVAHRIK